MVTLMRAGTRRFHGYSEVATLTEELAWGADPMLLSGEAQVEIARGCVRGSQLRFALRGHPEEVAAWAENLARKMRILQGAQAMKAMKAKRA